MQLKLRVTTWPRSCLLPAHNPFVQILRHAEAVLDQNVEVVLYVDVYPRPPREEQDAYRAGHLEPHQPGLVPSGPIVQQGSFYAQLTGEHDGLSFPEVELIEKRSDRDPILD